MDQNRNQTVTLHKFDHIYHRLSSQVRSNTQAEWWQAQVDTGNCYYKYPACSILYDNNGSKHNGRTFSVGLCAALRHFGSQRLNKCALCMCTILTGLSIYAQKICDGKGRTSQTQVSSQHLDRVKPKCHEHIKLSFLSLVSLLLLYLNPWAQKTWTKTHVQLFHDGQLCVQKSACFNILFQFSCQPYWPHNASLSNNIS